VDLESFECDGKASIVFCVNLNFVIMGLAPMGKWNIGGFEKNEKETA
jgi:hypothetical protein